MIKCLRCHVELTFFIDFDKHRMASIIKKMKMQITEFDINIQTLLKNCATLLSNNKKIKADLTDRRLKKNSFRCFYR